MMPPFGRGKASDCTAGQLAEALLPCCKSPSFLKYDEAPEVKKARIMVGLIREAHPILRACHDLDEKLSFKRKTVEAAMKIILGKKAAEWRLPETQHQEFVDTMTKRLLNVLHVVRQAFLKPVRPSWALELPWGGGEAVVKATSEEHVAIEHTYGFDEVTRKVWRRKESARGSLGEPEFAMEARRPEGAKDTDAVEAVWTDGHQQRVQGMMCIEYETLGKQRQDPSEMWVGERASNHNKLTVARKQDRSMLIILKEQGKQILQVNVKAWGPEDDEASIKKAGEFMITIAKVYANGMVEPGQALKSFRDGQMKLQGLGAKSAPKAASRAARRTRARRAKRSSKRWWPKQVRSRGTTSPSVHQLLPWCSRSRTRLRAGARHTTKRTLARWRRRWQKCIGKGFVLEELSVLKREIKHDRLLQEFERVLQLSAPIEGARKCMQSLLRMHKGKIV